MDILAISGSLRAASLNTMLLRATIRLAPADLYVRLSSSLGNLPLFNPDIEATDPPAVAALRAHILASDALVIASPEYAHGVTGVLKNGLDWMVGNECFVNKPVALFNVSPRATHAQAALRETLVTMSANIIDRACITVPLLGSGKSDDDVVGDLTMRASILGSLEELQVAANHRLDDTQAGVPAGKDGKLCS